MIPTYERRDRLPALLDAVRREPAEEIVVVVDGSRDGSLELLEATAVEDERVKPLFIENAGSTRALQAGVEHATGDVVLLLDDDVLPEPGLVAGHARRHAERDGLVVVGYMPVALPAERAPGEYPVDLYARAYERVCAEYEREPQSILRHLWAGNVSLRRSDCLRVGIAASEGMPEGYGYHEDRDFGIRCAAAGLVGVFDRRLLARHRYERTPESFLRASRISGRTRWTLHALHPESIGGLATDFYENGMPVPGRWLVRLARRPRARRPADELLKLTIRTAGVARWYRLESHAGHVLGTIEQQAGAFEAAAEARRGR